MYFGISTQMENQLTVDELEETMDDLALERSKRKQFPKSQVIQIRPQYQDIALTQSMQELTSGQLSEFLTRKVDYKQILQQSYESPNAIQMYVRVAGEILSSIQAYDNSAAENLKTVIDYLISISTLHPQDLKVLREIVAQQRGQLQTMDQQLSAKNDQISAMNGEIAALSAQIDTNRLELIEQQNANTQLRNKIDEQKQYIKQLVAQNNELSYNSQNKTELLVQLSKDNSQHLLNDEKAQLKNQSLNSALADAREQIKKLLKFQIEYQPILQEKQDEVVKLNNLLKKQTSDYDKQIKQMNQALDQNQEQMLSLQQKLSAAQSESQYYQGRYSDISNALSSEKHQLGSASFLRYNSSLLSRLNFSAIMYRVYQPRQKNQNPQSNGQPAGQESKTTTSVSVSHQPTGPEKKNKKSTQKANAAEPSKAKNQNGNQEAQQCAFQLQDIYSQIMSELKKLFSTANCADASLSHSDIMQILLSLKQSTDSQKYPSTEKSTPRLPDSAPSQSEQTGQCEDVLEKQKEGVNESLKIIKQQLSDIEALQTPTIVIPTASSKSSARDFDKIGANHNTPKFDQGNLVFRQIIPKETDVQQSHPSASATASDVKQIQQTCAPQLQDIPSLTANASIQKDSPQISDPQKLQQTNDLVNDQQRNVFKASNLQTAARDREIAQKVVVYQNKQDQQQAQQLGLTDCQILSTTDTDHTQMTHAEQFGKQDIVVGPRVNKFTQTTVEIFDKQSQTVENQIESSCSGSDVEDSFLFPERSAKQALNTTDVSNSEVTRIYQSASNLWSSYEFQPTTQQSKIDKCIQVSHSSTDKLKGERKPFLVKDMELPYKLSQSQDDSKGPFFYSDSESSASPSDTSVRSDSPQSEVKPMKKVALRPVKQNVGKGGISLKRVNFVVPSKQHDHGDTLLNKTDIRSKSASDSETSIIAADKDQQKMLKHESQTHDAEIQTDFEQEQQIFGICRNCLREYQLDGEDSEKASNQDESSSSCSPQRITPALTNAIETIAIANRIQKLSSINTPYAKQQIHKLRAQIATLQLDQISQEKRLQSKKIKIPKPIQNILQDSRSLSLFISGEKESLEPHTKILNVYPRAAIRNNTRNSDLITLSDDDAISELSSLSSSNTLSIGELLPASQPVQQQRVKKPIPSELPAIPKPVVQQQSIPLHDPKPDDKPSEPENTIFLTGIATSASPQLNQILSVQNQKGVSLEPQQVVADDYFPYKSTFQATSEIEKQTIKVVTDTYDPDMAKVYLSQQKQCKKKIQQLLAKKIQFQQRVRENKLAKNAQQVYSVQDGKFVSPFEDVIKLRKLIAQIQHLKAQQKQIQQYTSQCLTVSQAPISSRQYRNQNAVDLIALASQAQSRKTTDNTVPDSMPAFIINKPSSLSNVLNPLFIPSAGFRNEDNSYKHNCKLFKSVTNKVPYNAGYVYLGTRPQFEKLSFEEYQKAEQQCIDALQHFRPMCPEQQQIDYLQFQQCEQLGTLKEIQTHSDLVKINNAIFMRLKDSVAIRSLKWTQVLANDYLNSIVKKRVKTYDHQENYLVNILTLMLTSQKTGVRSRVQALIEFTANVLNYKHISFQAQMIHLLLFPTDSLTSWYAAFLLLNLTSQHYNVEECVRIHGALNYQTNDDRRQLTQFFARYVKENKVPTKVLIVKLLYDFNTLQQRRTQQFLTLHARIYHETEGNLRRELQIADPFLAHSQFQSRFASFGPDVGLRFLMATSFFYDVHNHRACLAKVAELTAACEEDMKQVIAATIALKADSRVQYQDAVNAQREVLILDETHKRLRGHIEARKCDMAFWWLQQFRFRLGTLALLVTALTTPRRGPG